MAVTKNRIARNLATIRENISAACARCGRSADDVSIIAVTKTVDIETIKNCLEVGLFEFGENRVPQLSERFDEFDSYLQRRRNPVGGTVKWHMIGHLQRNKVKVVLRAVDVVHSIDSLRLAEEMSNRARQDERVVDVMLQVNCSKEGQKFGCAMGAAVHLAETICMLPGLRLVGLMTMAALDKEPEKSRNAFARLRELFEELKYERIGGESLRHLSMGMSNDYEVAIEEGSTMVRIGSALFA